MQKRFCAENILNATPRALLQSLKDLDWRPVAYERNLWRHSKIAVQTFPAPKIVEIDSHGLKEFEHEYDFDFDLDYEYEYEYEYEYDFLESGLLCS